MLLNVVLSCYFRFVPLCFCGCMAVCCVCVAPFCPNPRFGNFVPPCSCDYRPLMLFCFCNCGLMFRVWASVIMNSCVHTLFCFGLVCSCTLAPLCSDTFVLLCSFAFPLTCARAWMALCSCASVPLTFCLCAMAIMYHVLLHPCATATLCPCLCCALTPLHALVLFCLCASLSVLLLFLAFATRCWSYAFVMVRYGESVCLLHLLCLYVMSFCECAPVLVYGKLSCVR